MLHTGSTKPAFLTAILTLISWAVLFTCGHVKDFCLNLLKQKRRSSLKGYAPLRQDYEDFYTRRMYYKLHDVFNRPIAGPPDALIDVLERTDISRGDGHSDKPLDMTGAVKRCFNLGSYNYLGFAAADKFCTPRALQVLEKQGWSTCSPRSEAGTSPLHEELDVLLADFIGCEAVLTFGMGFATNSLVMPALVSKGSLIVSDALNHASIVAGARGSGAKVKVFTHNSAESLEEVLRASIAHGQPRTRRPWKKIMVVIEGVYSMEGEMCDLEALVQICEKYKAYIYLDEAHSIGALGASGKGICEHAGVSPRRIDVMMGTFTKSFGSSGGYIGGSKTLINHLKHASLAHLSATSMSPVAAEQIRSAVLLLQGRDKEGEGGRSSGRGPEKLRQLQENANFFRSQLLAMGCNVLGSWDSPVMPIMLFQPAKIAAFSRRCFERNIAMVVVGFPATSLLTARARVCISAAHTLPQLEWAAKELSEIVAECGVKYQDPDHSLSLKSHLLLT